MHPAAGRGGVPTSSTGGSLALRGGSGSGSVGPRLRAEGLMVPPASDAATLRRQVAALQIDLEAHIDGEQRLQSINHELRERLELYMKQNHENVERAESELNTLHEDMEQTLELQRRLAQRAQTLEREKKDLEITMTKAVESFESERAMLNNRLSTMNHDLQLTNVTNMKDKLEERLQIITEETNFLKSKQEEYAEQMRVFLENQMLEDCYFEWLKLVHASQLRKKNLISHAKERARKILYSWEEYLTRARATPKKNQLAYQHHNLNLKRKTIEGWRQIVRLWTLNDEDEEMLTEIASSHYEIFKKKNVLSQWKDWLKYYIRPRKRKLLNVQAHINKMTMKQAMSAWQCIMRIHWMTRIKMEEAIKYEKRWIYIRTMSRFKEALKNINFERKLRLQASQHYSMKQTKLVVKNWRSLVQENRRGRIYQQVAFRYYANHVSKKTFKAWTEAVNLNKTERRAIREVNQCLMRAVMIFWREHHSYHLLK
ncbi:hypothetical protein M758_6G156600 [Ceratodon purpureus]|nr:hypothetical protein M758_6G156600 [Ceratodon purpureus]